MPCWDKALAQSFNSCGRARCPTCRAAVRVDFDPDSSIPSFTQDHEDMDPNNMRQRIAEQMRPVQIRLLKAYGAAHPLEHDSDREEDLSEALSKALVAASCTGGDKTEGAPCVCGSCLKRVSLAERKDLLNLQIQAWQDSQDFRPFLVDAQVVCDLCDGPTSADGQQASWVCVNGDGTIKHATFYDICDRCVVLHAWGNQL